MSPLQHQFPRQRRATGAANGAVRCGTCLKVFNALQHQVGGAPRANAPSAAEAKPAAAPPPAPSVAAATSAAPRQRPRDETLWIHDDLDLDSLNLDEELAKLDEFELNQEFSSIEKARDRRRACWRAATTNAIHTTNAGPRR